MAKRILSLILSCALLLGCISGLTLVTAAEETATPTYAKVDYTTGEAVWENTTHLFTRLNGADLDMNERIEEIAGKYGQKLEGQGVNDIIFSVDDIGIAAGDQVAITIEYYLPSHDLGGSRKMTFRNTRVNENEGQCHIKETADEVNNANYGEPLVTDEWATYTVVLSNEEAVASFIGGRGEVIFRYYDDAKGSIGYIGSITIEKYVEAEEEPEEPVEELYAKVDFSTGAPVWENATHQESLPNVMSTEDNGIVAVGETGKMGLKMYGHNNTYLMFHAGDIGIAEGDQVAITVEYYLPSHDKGGNRSLCFRDTKVKEGENQCHIMENPDNEKNANYGEPLKLDEWATYTVVLPVETSASFIGGNRHMNFRFYDNNGGNGEVGYIGSITIEKYVAADKTELEEAVAKAEAMEMGFYTEESVAAYTAVLDAAKAVLAKDGATEEEIKAAVDALTAAEKTLVKAAFDVVVESVTTTEGDRPKIGNTVKFIITVKNNGDATIPAGAKYGGTIKIEGVSIIWSDNYKSVDKAPALEPGATLELTTCGGGANGDGSWVVTEGNVEVTAEVNDDRNNGIYETEVENNFMTVTLTPGNVDYSALTAAIAEAEAIENVMQYTEESVAALNEALAAAKAALTEATTQEAVDAAVAALAAAKDALVVGIDLIVESITTSDGDVPKVGEKVNFLITVKNIGTGTVPAGALYGAIVTIDGIPVIWSDHYKTSLDAPELAPGETIVLTTCGGGASGDGTWVVTEGDVKLSSQVNDNRGAGVAETDENWANNTLEVTLKTTTLDLAALKAAITAAEAIENMMQYTEESVAALNEALEAAKAALEALESQEAVDAAATALTTAKNELVVGIDLIVESITTSGGDVPKVGEKVNFLITVKNIGTGTVPAGALYGAIVTIDGIPVIWSDHYKTSLDAPELAPGETIVLTTCGGGASGDGTWVVTEGDVKLSSQVNDNRGAGIAETDENWTNNTLEATLKTTTLDLAALKAAIEEVEALEGLDQYTEESVAALNEALTAAKAALEAMASQDAVDAAVAALAAAKEALEIIPEGILGDVNDDGKVNTSDARYILQLAAEKIAESDLNMSMADTDGNGKVNTTDARYILQLAAEKIDKLPAAE